MKITDTFEWISSNSVQLQFRTNFYFPGDMPPDSPCMIWHSIAPCSSYTTPYPFNKLLARHRVLTIVSSQQTPILVREPPIVRSHITSNCGWAVSPLADCLNTSHGDANSCQKQLIIHRRPACSARPARSPSVIVRRNNYVHVTCMQPYKSANVCFVIRQSHDGLTARCCQIRRTD